MHIYPMRSGNHYQLSQVGTLNPLILCRFSLIYLICPMSFEDMLNKHNYPMYISSPDIPLRPDRGNILRHEKPISPLDAL